MIPNKGLRPHQFTSAALRQSMLVRSGASRQFSSLPRNKGLSTLPGRASPLRATKWRAGAPLRPNLHLSASSVRYGSWYAPWTWGASTEKDTSFIEAHKSAATASSSTSPANIVAESSEPVVTSATPELAPAGIDKTAVVDSNPTTLLPDSIDGLLNDAPTSSGVADPTQLITYWGNLKDLGLDYGWGTTSFFESLMELSYLNLEMGWTGSIVASAFALRTIMFICFQRASSDSLAKVAAMKPVLQPLMDQLEEAKRQGDDAKVENVKMQQQTVMKQIGPDMFKNMLTPVAQMAFGFGAFRCLNGMAALPAPGMTSESFLWISNLTVSDPYFILPGMVGGILYVVMKAGGETGVANRTTMTSMQKNVMKGLPVVMACITAFQPAALQFYFVVSSILGGATGYILRQPAARRFLRIRALPSKESEKLYSKVVKGEIPLETLRGPDGRVRYQAPRKKTPSRQFSSKPTLERATLKPGLVLPPHMAAPSQMLTPADKELMDRDFDYNDGMSGSLSDKFDWIKRNYKPSFVVKRTWRAMSGDNRDIHVIAEQRKREKAKADAAKYEVERKRRFEGR